MTAYVCMCVSLSSGPPYPNARLELVTVCRVLCAKQCCLPSDHGPTIQHCCRVHLKYGGSLSREVMDSWEVFSWGHGVLRKARRLWASTYRLMSKWRMVRLMVLGAMMVLWFAVQPAPPARPNGGAYGRPQLTYPYTRGMDDPYEVIGMMRGHTQGRHVELSEGYHKRAYVYVGELPLLATFDTGSFRNAIQLELLMELEAKQRAGQLGAHVVSPRALCGKHNVLGATNTMKGSLGRNYGQPP